ncbi:hypothetical protein BP5796_10102 [Coleophoma crateriformis]|uniref:Uncharacterized protein n=1 Tax=Coleophoma crateriformis TaxID=565419 RepID=A0A3D8QUS3_9HELO|nr:hypothetical protein BP5796_10102 [Coleophoma crateriformis]
MVDTTGQGDFKNAVKATMTTQVPGTKGNIKKTTKRWEELLIRVGLLETPVPARLRGDPTCAYSKSPTTMALGRSEAASLSSNPTAPPPHPPLPL